jgi:hypothetical protein
MRVEDKGEIGVHVARHSACLFYHHYQKSLGWYLRVHSFNRHQILDLCSICLWEQILMVFLTPLLLLLNSEASLFRTHLVVFHVLRA